MARPAKPLPRGRWRAVALSILLHALIVAAAVYGWFTWKHEPPEPQTMAIEATVVDAAALPSSVPQPPQPDPELEPEPEPPPQPEPEPPKPDPAEEQRKIEETRQEQQRVEREQRETETRLQAEREAAEKAAAEKAAAEKKAAEKKRADDAAAAKKAAEEKARAAREAQLRRSLEAEERATAMRNSDLADQWRAQIAARIQRAWIKPPSAQPGIVCTVFVTQVPGGDVTGVRVEGCTGGDEALRASVETAVYRASPLPNPPHPALFERVLRLNFRPTE